MEVLHNFIKSHFSALPISMGNQSKDSRGFIEQLLDRGLRFIYNDYKPLNMNLLYVNEIQQNWVPFVLYISSD